jgi:CarD family transcriptional regulator
LLLSFYGDRRKIAKVANTLMRKNQELMMNKKRLYDQDRRILNTIQNLLFKELAMTLNTSDEKIYEMIHNMINEEYASPLKEQA